MESALHLCREWYALQGKTIAQQLLASIPNIRPHKPAFASDWPMYFL